MTELRQAARIGRTIADSEPSFTALPKPRDGAPNVVVILLDDLGFAQLGCFGSDIDTPAIDQLAAEGVRANRFHVTALCSPTRACVLTGRNHHAVGMGFLTDVPVGYPGYTARIPQSAATMPRLLRDAGYSTFAVGKWHLAPRWEQSASGPFTQWPLGLGFERYYGFLNGDTNQWTPALVRDNGFIDPPRRPEEGYHLTEDLADQAIRMVQDQQQATPDKPFLLYFAPGATHAPHQAPRAWIDRFRGRFDQGWEAWREEIFARQLATGIVPEATTLPTRPPWVADWNELPADERRLFARMMEVFAGFLSHTDAQIGRVLGFLDEIGASENTIVLALSDNGTSAEGGPIGSLNEHRFIHDEMDDIADTIARADELGGFRAYNHYAWGWAWAGNTPHRLWKRFTWLGGVRTPLVVRWPRGIAARGEIRSQFCHAIDLLPTVLDAAGIDAPEVVGGVTQQRIDGASLLPTLTDADAPAPHDTQYFEMLGSRAIYHDGWKATTDHVGQQLSVEVERVTGSQDFDEDHWALFHLDEDFSEAHDVSAEHPDKVRALIEQWWSEAGRNQVLPISDSFLERIVALEPSPNGMRWRAVLRPGGGPISEDALPPLGSGFRIAARLDVPAGGANGVLCSLGDWSNGWACYLHEGRPVVAFALLGEVMRLAGEAAVPSGVHTVTVSYEQAKGRPGGTVRLAVDAAVVAEGELSRHLPFRWQIGGGGFLVGRDAGFPVVDDYTPPAPFTGTLHTLEIVVPALAPADLRSELAAALKHE
ncbi:MAG TPA: arylsulfatase [Acidimicrobiia bacterium]|nr:arylsulfatase [Acidimicrobiia bacterium]